MINRIIIDGFKRFEHEEFELRNLTVLAGRNGAGKTSLIHSLLLVENAIRRNDGTAQLNGPYDLELGWFGDLVNINRFGKNPEFIIRLETEGGGTEWTFSKGDTNLYAAVKQSGEGRSPSVPTTPRSFQYISAERLGPRLIQRSSAKPSMLLEVGHTGAHVAQVIERLIPFSVPAARLAGDKSRGPTLLKDQTEFWLTDIVRPTVLDTNELAGTDVIALRFKTPEGDWVRPTNMGFGVSYALPIIVAALTASDGGLLIVENPEAHLHPGGQSEMGRFLVQMAASGLQVIVETHSDHVLNGIRLAIGGGSPLGSNQAVVHYFPDEEQAPQKLTFTRGGSFLDWPSGFFDQYRIDVAKLTQLPRPR